MKEISPGKLCHCLLFICSAVFFGSCIRHPDEPNDPSPANGTVINSINPLLCATVSDPRGRSLQVRYFGRQRTDSHSKKFTIIFLPDTQYYTEEPQGNRGARIDMFRAQTKWIADNRVSRNIVYVGHLGDCVQNGDSIPGSAKDIEWQRATTAIKTIEDADRTGLPQGIPFGISVGNHDQTPNSSASGTTILYNQFFGSNHFAGRGYYGGHYGSNNDNFYDLFSASGIDFLVISFEFDQTGSFSAPGGALDWGENLVRDNPGRKVIVMTHYAMNETTSFSPQGQAIYDRLKAYPNFCLMVCGHRHSSDGEANRVNIYKGNMVYTLLSDYQARPGGGNGLLRIMEFDPGLNKISIKTYSPYVDRYETDPDSQFELSLNMLPMIGQVNNASSGTKACMNWNDLAPASSYLWDMEIYNGETVTIGPIWSFTTPDH
jgi:hypothetical protein